MFKNPDNLRVIDNIQELRTSFNYCKGLEIKDFIVNGNNVVYKKEDFTFEFTFPLNIIYSKEVNLGQKGEFIHQDIGYTSLSDLCAVNKFTVYYDNEKLCQIEYLDYEKATLDKMFELIIRKKIVNEIDFKDGVIFFPLNANFISLKDGGAYIDNSKIDIKFFNLTDKIKFYFDVYSNDKLFKFVPFVLNDYQIDENNIIKIESFDVKSSLDDFILNFDPFGVSKTKIAIPKNNPEKTGAFIANEVLLNMNFRDNRKLRVDDILLLAINEKDKSIVDYKVDKINNYSILNLNVDLQNKSKQGMKNKSNENELEL